MDISHFRRQEKPMVHHQGIFRREISFVEAVAFIVSGTIGAGILGIPYAIAKVGVFLGLVCIVSIGLLMIALHLLLARVAVVQQKDMQLAGLAGVYLGPVGKWLMTVITYALLVGVLVVYIIGVGQTLTALFGGAASLWSVGFALVVGLLISAGLRTIKTVELFLCLGVLTVVLVLVGVSSVHIQTPHLLTMNIAELLVPYGVLLFAFHGVSSVPEAYSLLGRKRESFSKVIMLAGSIVMVVYALFATVVVGVTGSETTSIATIGLGKVIGPTVFVLGNVFAVLAMGTSSLMAGLSLRDSLRWDFHLSTVVSSAVVVTVPLAIFALGVRGFVSAMEVIGGVFMSTQMLLVLLVYEKAKKNIEPTARIRLSPVLPLILFLFFSGGALYSVFHLLS